MTAIGATDPGKRQRAALRMAEALRDQRVRSKLRSCRPDRRKPPVELLRSRVRCKPRIHLRRAPGVTIRLSAHIQRTRDGRNHEQHDQRYEIGANRPTTDSANATERGKKAIRCATGRPPPGPGGRNAAHVRASALGGVNLSRHEPAVPRRGAVSEEGRAAPSYGSRTRPRTAGAGESSPRRAVLQSSGRVAQKPSLPFELPTSRATRPRPQRARSLAAQPRGGAAFTEF